MSHGRKCRSAVFELLHSMMYFIDSSFDQFIDNTKAAIAAMNIAEHQEYGWQQYFDW